MQKYNIFIIRRKKAKRLQGIFFFLGEPAQLRGRRFQASQTCIHGPTSVNVGFSRRAVGLSVTIIFATVPYVRMIIRTYNPLSANVLPSKIGKNHFHFNPSRTPVRNTIPFRGELTKPLARTFFPRRELQPPAIPL
jgi:hypothetical protein